MDLFVVHTPAVTSTPVRSCCWTKATSLLSACLA